MEKRRRRNGWDISFAQKDRSREKFTKVRRGGQKVVQVMCGVRDRLVIATISDNKVNIGQKF